MAGTAAGSGRAWGGDWIFTPTVGSWAQGFSATNTRQQELSLSALAGYQVGLEVGHSWIDTPFEAGAHVALSSANFSMADSNVDVTGLQYRRVETGVYAEACATRLCGMLGVNYGSDPMLERQDAATLAISTVKIVTWNATLLTTLIHRPPPAEERRKSLLQLRVGVGLSDLAWSDTTALGNHFTQNRGINAWLQTDWYLGGDFSVKLGLTSKTQASPAGSQEAREMTFTLSIPLIKRQYTNSNQ